jgi:hypothetical protein
MTTMPGVSNRRSLRGRRICPLLAPQSPYQSQGDSEHLVATFVLIHGAGDIGWYWNLVQAELRRRGHDAIAPDLPGEPPARWWGNTGYSQAVHEQARRDGGLTGSGFPFVAFYHDVPRALAEEAMGKERDESDAAHQQPWPLTAWPAVTTRFVLCTEDRFFRPSSCVVWWSTGLQSSLTRSSLDTASP